MGLVEIPLQVIKHTVSFLKLDSTRKNAYVFEAHVDRIRKKQILGIFKRESNYFTLTSVNLINSRLA
jgi:hypothetical protein